MGARLTKLYTRTGDDGTTGLANGKRVDKDSLRIDVIGDIDELNSMLGILTTSRLSDDIAGYVLNIQHRLFDIGAELAIEGEAVTEPDHVKRIEELIDTYNSELGPLSEFILPGGTMTGALFHLARSVCRRTERKMVKLAREEFVNSNTLIYINRLSDLLFVFARVATNQEGAKEVYWDKDRLKHSV